MFQQIIALFFVLSFLSRLVWQKKKKQIEKNEFVFWFVFWFVAGLLIVFLKQIDVFVASLGFSSTGIDVLFYISVIFLFYLLLRIRIRQERIEREITDIVREIAIRDNK